MVEISDAAGKVGGVLSRRRALLETLDGFALRSQDVVEGSECQPNDILGCCATR